MIGLRHVTHSLGGRTVLRDASLAIEPGEGVFLQGPNGSGKTTLWRIMAGILRPERGVVTWGGQPIHADDWPIRKARIGVVGHGLMAQPMLSALENLSFVARLAGRRNGHEEARQWLLRAGLGAVLRQPLSACSRGQRQRYALARAFHLEPDVVLLDEPFAGLDAGGRALLKEWLAEHRARGGAALVIDHDPALAAEVTSKDVRLEGGRIVPEVARS